MKTKKVLSVIIAFAMVVCLLPAMSFTAFAADRCLEKGGDGVYHIKNLSFTDFKESWAGFWLDVQNGYTFEGETVSLDVNNLNISPVNGTYIIGSWTENNAKPFCGTFEGNGNTVEISYSDSSSNDVGVFSHTNGAVIRNLTVSGIVSGGMSVAGIVGNAYNTTFINCTNNATVYGTSLYTGGIAGWTGGGSSFLNCINNGEISGGKFVGGIIGYEGSAVSVENCRSMGKVISAYGAAHPKEGDYIIYSAMDDSKCLNISGLNDDLQIWSAASATAKTFRLIYNEDVDDYYIQSVNSGYMLSPDFNLSYEHSEWVNIYQTQPTYVSWGQQHWTFAQDRDNHYYIRSEFDSTSGWYMNLASGSIADGNAVIAYKYQSGGLNDRFRLMDSKGQPAQQVGAGAITGNSASGSSYEKCVYDKNNCPGDEHATGVLNCYFNENGESVKLAKFSVVTNNTTMLGEGVHVVSGEVTVNDRMYVDGNVTLVLADNSTLVAKSGIGFAGDNKEHRTFTVTAQSKRKNMGKLITYSYYDYSGIGANEDKNYSNFDIVINGGNIDSLGRDSGAGIGSCCTFFSHCACGNITINGGNIKSVGGFFGAGIGSGEGATCGVITINGGNVNAVGGEKGAGIGSGSGGKCNNIIINGGSIKATGNQSEDIGAGKNGTCGTVSYGTVTHENEYDSEWVNLKYLPEIAADCTVGGHKEAYKDLKTDKYYTVFPYTEDDLIGDENAYNRWITSGDGYFAPLGHSYEWKTTKYPTCTEDGTETSVCTRCGEPEGKTKPIPAGHNYSYIGSYDEDTEVYTLKKVCSVCREEAEEEAITYPVSSESLGQYLVVTDKAYIDTGYKPTSDTHAVMDVNVNSNKEYWFGMWNVTYNNGAFALGNDGGNVYAGYGNDGGGYGSAVSNGRHTVELNKNVAYIDGSVLTRLDTFGAFTLDYPLYLFAQNRKAELFIPDNQKITCYSFQILENDTLLHYCIPYVNDGKAGLYDLVEGEFFGNANSVGTMMTVKVIPEKAPTCIDNGYKSHYYSIADDAYFEDSAFETRIDDIDAWKTTGNGSIPATGVHIDDDKDGYCDVCGFDMLSTECDVTYLDRIINDDNTVTAEEVNLDRARVIGEDDSVWGSDKFEGTTIWYVLDKNVTLNKRPEVKGNVAIVLKNGCTLTANKGITLEEGNSLAIYAQSDDESVMGSIVGMSEEGNAVIGGTGYAHNISGDFGKKGGDGHNCGTLSWNGGILELTATNDVCIGGGTGMMGSCSLEEQGLSARAGGAGGDGGTVTVCGGVLRLSGKRGIGGGNGGKGGYSYNESGEKDANGGKGGDGGTVNFIDGTVTICCSNRCLGGGDGADSGDGGNHSGHPNYGGKGGDGGTVTFVGGTVTLQSDSEACVGGGFGGMGNSDNPAAPGADAVLIIENEPVMKAGDDADSAKVVTEYGGEKYFSVVYSDENHISLETDGNAFTVILSDKGAKSGIIIVALYDREDLNRLLDVKIFDLSKTNELTGTFEEPGYVKAFWWNSFSDAAPLCEAGEGNIASEGFIVSFNMMGHGNRIKSQSIKEDEKAQRPADPTAEGCLFGGWYKDKNCTEEWDFNTVITANTTIYALWIDKNLVKEEVKAYADAAKVNINNMKWLDGDKSNYTSAIDTAVTTANESIENAESKDGVTAAKEAAKREIDGEETEALNADIREKEAYKSSAILDVDTAACDAKNNIDSLLWLSGGDKTSYLNEIDYTEADACAKIEAADSKPDIDKAKADAKDEFVKQKNAAKDRNDVAKLACIANAEVQLEKYVASSMESIDAMDWLTGDAKDKYKKQISDIRNSARTQIELADSAYVVEDIVINAKSAIDRIINEAEAEK